MMTTRPALQAQPLQPQATQALSPGRLPARTGAPPTAARPGFDLSRIAILPSRSGEGLLQRACASCEEEEKGARMDRKATGDAAPAMTAPPIAHDVLRTPGQPLDPAARSSMEARFGHDFSRVRVHADGQAARAASAVQARAYTVGRDIVFNAGEYAPGTAGGKQLLAHELAHVVQQRAAGEASLHPKLQVGADDDPHEREADRIADAVVAAEGESSSATA